MSKNRGRRGKRKIPHLAFLSRVNKQRYYVFAEWRKKCVCFALCMYVQKRESKILICWENNLTWNRAGRALIVSTLPFFMASNKVFNWFYFSNFCKLKENDDDDEVGDTAKLLICSPKNQVTSSLFECAALLTEVRRENYNTRVNMRAKRTE